MPATIAYRRHHGAWETNAFADPQAEFAKVDYSRLYKVSDPQVVTIVKVRAISSPGFPFWDVQYVHGELADGSRVRVDLGITQIPKGNVTGTLVDAARNAGRYAKGIGLLRPDVVSLCQ